MKLDKLRARLREGKPATEPAPRICSCCMRPIELVHPSAAKPICEQCQLDCYDKSIDGYVHFELVSEALQYARTCERCGGQKRMVHDAGNTIEIESCVKCFREVWVRDTERSKKPLT